MYSVYNAFCFHINDQYISFLWLLQGTHFVTWVTPMYYSLKMPNVYAQVTCIGTLAGVDFRYMHAISAS